MSPRARPLARTALTALTALTAPTALLFAPVVIVAAFSTPAMADVAVLVMPGNPETETADASAAIEAAGFSARELGPLRMRLEAAARASLTSEEATLSKLEAGLKAARVQYLEQDWDAMLEDLDRVRAETLWLLARRENRALLWEVCFQRGIAFHARKGRGDTVAGNREFALANALEPERRPPSDIYGPDVGQAFAAAVAAIGGAARPFKVTSAPADAGVVIDGVALVGQPGRSLSAGLHVVLVSAPGHEPSAQIVDSRETSAIAVTLSSLGEDAADASAPAWVRGELRPGTASSNALLARLARERGADAVLWLGDGSPLEVIWLDASGATALESAASSQSALAALLDRVGRDGVVKADRSLATAPTPQGSTRTWLIVGGVGAALVAIVVAGVLISKSESGGDRVEIGIVP